MHFKLILPEYISRRVTFLRKTVVRQVFTCCAIVVYNAYSYLTPSTVHNPTLSTVSSSCLNRRLSKHAGHAHAMDVCGSHTWSKEIHKNDNLIPNYEPLCFCLREADRAKQKKTIQGQSEGAVGLHCFFNHKKT